MTGKSDTTIVLVHGSWGGGWVWDEVVASLTGAGRRILAPTLTGLGDRAHLIHEGIDHELHAEDIVQTIEFADASNIVLVGHSYGGLVASAVACRIPERIRSLVIVDGFLAETGRSIFDLHPEISAITEPLLNPTAPWQMMPLPASAIGLPDGPQARRHDARSRPMPIRTHSTPFREDMARLAAIDRHYIRCTDFPIFAATADKAEREGWRRGDIETGHMVMFTQPGELARGIEDITTMEG
ncbi:esterase [Mesorhizobium sp. L-8-10]|uniref:alpha/beta fold hydrolase n=1 Tax=Mesorhizobium sp. L-8-10 TaxID=2744523 RepID=UPI0019255F17|nr:alpha/beta hydrolase [Mesorhizobium sp. L-8-10]BCH31896.1 esterase [Mesorhizobium sp. L-8-10]